MEESTETSRATGVAPSDLPRALSAAHQSDFAYDTVKDRLPIILTRVVDELYRERATVILNYGGDTREKIKGVIGRLSQLKNEIQTDKPIPLIEDSRDDSHVWNDYIEEETATTGTPPSWFKSPWLFVECYMYRKIQEAFELSTILKMFDPFASQKEAALINSLDAMKSLARFLDGTLATQQTDSKPTTNFCQLIQADLWGNKCDLSISNGEDNAQKNDPIIQLDQLRSNILVNDTDQVWNTLRQAKSTKGDIVRVDFILDNAGFELFADLCLADFLYTHRLATYIVFHAKPMPWFVSDTTPRDLNWTLQTLRGMSGEPLLSQLAAKWEGNVERGDWKVRSDQFWTLPHDFDAMQHVSPNLYTDLSKSNLLLFKGDLNYRKLTGDRKWDPTVPFRVALRSFRPTNLCSLRTLKADVVVGLAAGQAETVREQQEKWMISGDYAVIQYYAP